MSSESHQLILTVMTWDNKSQPQQMVDEPGQRASGTGRVADMAEDSLSQFTVVPGAPHAKWSRPLKVAYRAVSDGQAL